MCRDSNCEAEPRLQDEGRFSGQIPTEVFHMNTHPTQPDRALPRMSLLSAEQRAQIHARSLRILGETGIRVDSPRGRAVLTRAPGVTFPQPDRALFAAEAVEAALETAPPTVELYDRRGQPAFSLGAGRTRFGIGVTNLYYEEPLSGEIVPFARRHMADAARMAGALPGYDVVSTMGVLHDVPVDAADLVATLDLVASTAKPLVLLVSDPAQFGPCLDLLEHLCGDPASRPSVMPYVNPITPLVLNAETVDKALDSIDRGLPLIYSNYGMAGLTTPILPAATLALLNAELLAGLMLCQAARPGAPIILGSLPAYFDMRTLVDFYDPRSMLLDLACAEMMAGYGLPHAGASGSGNGWGPDLSAAGALWLNILTAGCGSPVARGGLAPFIGGNLGSKVFSPATAVYAHEIIAQMRAFAGGFGLDDAAFALDEVAAAGPGGSFLEAESTLRNLRTAYHDSRLFPHWGLEGWQAAGSPDATERLRQATAALIASAPAPADRDELVARGEGWIRARGLALEV